MTLHRTVFPRIAVRRRGFVAASLALIGGLVSSAPCGATESGVGAPPVEDFSLSSVAGERVRLGTSDDSVAATLLFFGWGDCEVSGKYAARLGQLEREYREDGLRVLAVFPGMADSATVARQAAEFELEFPVLHDPTLVVTERLGVERMGEVILLDDQRNVLYRGAIDDQYQRDEQKSFADEEWLLEALESYVMDGEAPEVFRTEAPGLLIHAEEQGLRDITYYEHVAPILRQQCVECHRPGQIGPMTFLEYEEVRGWAPMVGEVVLQNRMPPWHASPDYGEFKNARHLTETEKELLVRWAEQGAPEGDPRHKQPTPVFEDQGWTIGKPDMVLQLPEVQSVPAEGTVPYRHIVVDPGLTEDRWVKSVEIRPSNPAVTHHVLVLLIPPESNGQAVRRDRDFFLGSGHFAVNVPGSRPLIFPDGYGQLLRAGTKFLFQLHYTPNGVAALDQTQMAMCWATSEVKHRVKSRAVINTAIDIPPHAASTSFDAVHEFDGPIQILALFPHMHSRGKAFRVEVLKPREKAILLDVPAYDFNWQHTYEYENPPILDQGDTLYLTATYDNSAANPSNPDPSQRVRWGDQTWEEMLVGYVTYIETDPSMP